MMVKKEIRILLVEDSPDDVMFAEIQFNNIFGDKHSVEVSAYFSKAFALVQKKVFDIIILDLSLPDSEGLTNFTKLLQSCNIPIIIYTGLDNELVKNEAMQIGAMDYLIKGRTTEETLKASILNSISRYAPSSIKKNKKGNVVKIGWFFVAIKYFIAMLIQRGYKLCWRATY